MSFFTCFLLSIGFDSLLLSGLGAALAFAPTPTILKAPRLGIQAAFEPTARCQAENQVLELRQNSQSASLATCGWVDGNTGWWKPLLEIVMASLAEQTDSKPSNVWRIIVLRDDQYVHRLLRTLIVYRHLYDLLRLARCGLQCGLPK
jgi:hypothetical protein